MPLKVKGFKRGPVILVLLGIAVMAILQFSVLHSYHKDAIRSAEHDVAMGLLAVDGYLGNIERNIDMAYRVFNGIMKDDDFRVRPGLGNPYIESQIIAMRARLPELQVIGITDAKGNYIYHSGGNYGVNLGDRSYFKTQVAGEAENDTTMVLHYGRTTNAWTIATSKRMTFSDRSFAGIFIAGIDLDDIEKYASQYVAQHRNASITIRDTNNVVAMSIGAQGTNKAFDRGQKAPITMFENVTIPRGKIAFTHGKRPVDGEEVIAGYLHSHNGPFVITASVSRQAYLDAWDHMVILSAVTSFLVISLIGGLLHHINKMRGSQWMIERANKRLEQSQLLAGLCSWVNVKGEILIEWSANARRIFGEYLPQGYGEIMRLIPHEDKACFVENWRRLQSGTHVDFRHRLRLGDHQIWVRQIAESHETEDGSGDKTGHRVIYSGTMMDITDQVREEEARNLSASVFDNTSEGMIITSPQGVILNVNPAFSEITGYNREEVLGQTPALLKSGCQDEQFYDGMWAALSKTGSWKGEIWNRRKNGEVFIESLTISSARDSAGKLLCYIGIFSDISMIKAHHQRLEQAASHDALTQLPNRLRLREIVNRELAIAGVTNHMVAVCFIDLDDFKPINDQYGHHVGDLLLIEAAQRLVNAIRPYDFASRIGGDEFIIVLSRIQSESEIQEVGDRLLKEISRPYDIGDYSSLKVSATIGISVYPQDDSDADGLIRHADQAMYTVKRDGKGKIGYFNATESREMCQRNEILARIARAIDDDEIILYYQPKVDMQTGTVIGCEALARWKHPERGILGPMEFLPIIENTPLSITLGYKIIEAAVRQIDKWIREEDLLTQVSVNVPGNLLLDKGFAERVAEIMQRYPSVGGHLLQMEILESVALENIELARSIIAKCQQMGISIALDDFGTGYSSLAYLKRLHVNVVKVDQSFVRSMLIDREDFAIAGAVSELSRTFNCGVIAEGVETIEHGVALIRIGYRFAQGFSISRPIHPADYPMFCRTWECPQAWRKARRWHREHIPFIEGDIAMREWIHCARQQLCTEATFQSGLNKFHSWLHSQEIAKHFARTDAYQKMICLEKEILDITRRIDPAIDGPIPHDEINRFESLRQQINSYVEDILVEVNHD